MSRRLPRSFFWIDQSVIRSGAWQRLSAEARLAYVALAASCDREGLSIWSSPKLMELAACLERESWGARISELESCALVERVVDHSPPAIRLKELDSSARGDVAEAPRPSPAPPTQFTTPIIVQTTIHLGGNGSHAESRKAD